jgi:hypothetical protein
MTASSMNKVSSIGCPVRGMTAFRGDGRGYESHHASAPETSDAADITFRVERQQNARGARSAQTQCIDSAKFARVNSSVDVN